MMRLDRFQFGIRRLLILTTAVGLIIAVVIRIVPDLFRPAVAAYFFLASWIIMRSPYVYGRLSELRMQMRQVKPQNI